MTNTQQASEVEHYITAELENGALVRVTNDGVFFLGVKVCGHTGNLERTLDSANATIAKFKLMEAK